MVQQQVVFWYNNHFDPPKNHLVAALQIVKV